MVAVVHIAGAGALFYFASLAIGKLILRMLGVRLYAGEYYFLGFIVGAASLSEVVFVIALAGLAYKGVFWVLLIGLIVVERFLPKSKFERLPPLAFMLRILFFCGYLVYGALYVAHALLPETSPDGTGYHLGFVAEQARTHRILASTTSIYADFPQGAEMLFLLVFGIGKHSSAAMVHAGFLLALPIGILNYGRRFGFAFAGVAAALLFFMSPIVGRDGTVAYVDVALASVAFATVYLGEIWLESRDDRALLVLGFVAGFCIAIKYTGFVALVYALLLVAFAERKKMATGQVGTLFLAAFISFGPWLIKNAIVVHNPVGPFANALFRNPYVHISFERDYLRDLVEMYDVKLWQVPLEACVRGQKLSGLLGPVFLLTPLAFLGVRRPHVKNLVAAGTLFLIPYFGNLGTRFLMPCALFFICAVAAEIARLPVVLLIVVFTHAVLSWPTVVPKYCDQYAWRLDDSLNWDVVFRRVPESTFIDSRTGGALEMSRKIETLVPRDQRVLCLGSFPRAYIERDLIESYESALGQTLVDGLYSAAYPGRAPTQITILRTRAVSTSKVRIVQERSDRSDLWSVNEVRVLSGGLELPKGAAWQISAQPDPWEAGLAFDDNLATRWRSWEAYRSGMFLEVDFGGGRAQQFDGVRIEADPGAGNAVLGLEMWNGERWEKLPVKVEVGKQDTGDLGFAATRALKAKGVYWLLTHKDDYGAQEIAGHTLSWGLRLVGSRGDLNLYHVE